MYDLIRATAIAALACPVLLAQNAPETLPDPRLPLLQADEPILVPMKFDQQGDIVDRQPYELDAFRSMSPTHQDMLLRLFRRPHGAPAMHGCWQVMPPPAVAELFNAAIEGPGDFQYGQRWTWTSGSGSVPGLGTPTIIRYSFVPDGTFIPSGVGEPSAQSNMFAQLNSAFGSTVTWQNVIHDALEDWSELTGVTYVHEPNDDGASMFNAGGVVGTRGDVRIGMKFIDGGSNTLAYNSFPSQGGDMVLDSADANNFASSFQNYRFFANVVTHEAGHGLGIAHVCPLNNTKLMEPIATTFFAGPQFDDILTAQRMYGDPLEPNESYVTPTDLGTLPNTTTNVTNVSIDGNSDYDLYRFEVLTPKLVTINVVPVGSAYLEGPQVGQCNTGSSFNPAAQRNLNVFLYNSTGTSLITFSATALTGQTESITNYALDGGAYAIRVTATGVDTIQPYRLEVQVVDNGPTATRTTFGTSCGPIAWNPLTDPILGLNAVHTLSGIPNPASSIGLVLFGTNGIPSGVSLAPLGAPGCSVYLQADTVITVFPLTNSSMVWILPIPNDPGLVGLTVWTQGGLVVPPGTNPLGLLTANAAELFLGTN